MILHITTQKTDSPYYYCLETSSQFDQSGKEIPGSDQTCTITGIQPGIFIHGRQVADEVTAHPMPNV